MNTIPENENECPLSCPRRRRDGITLDFGKQKIHLDPFEILIFMLLTLPIGISIRDAWSGNLPFKESVERILAISAIGAVVRMSPTEQVSNFLSNFYIGRK